MQTYDLAPGHRISRVIKGGWQLAGGHGEIDRQASIEDMIAFADSGITTFDCADIYTGVEALIGDFRKEYERVRGAEALGKIKVHTKFVPDLGNLATLTKCRRVRRHRNLTQAPEHGAAQPGSVSLVGL
jgi:aryl-alcohol dehydrogenase-like predicted oxidoreductase